jgi:hypothetical protein
MLNENDMEWLLQQLVGTAELLGFPITPPAAAMLADDLSSYPKEVLGRALSRLRNEHTGRLTPKSILDRIDEVMGRPAANEAWALAVEAMDERATVVWTNEMSDAWLVAKSLAAEGDMVGARMAFIAAYERLVRIARDSRTPPEVSVSLGWDKDGREVALDKAVQLGRITAEAADKHRVLKLAAPAIDAVALLEGKAVDFPGAPPDVRARLAVLRATLADRRRADEEARDRAVREEHRALQERKAEIQRQVNEHLAAQQAGGAA